MRRVVSGAALAALVLAGSSVSATAGRFYRLASATTLPGAAPAWDYVSYEPTRGLLFIGRRKDGVIVFDTHKRRIVKTISRSQGANSALLIPSLDRGFTANEDGSTTMFRLSTLATIGRIKFADDADSAVYDPATGEVAFMSGDSRKITFLKAATGKLLGTLPMASESLEASAPDGKETLFIAERDRDMVAHVDMKSHELLGEWATTGCDQPTGMALDRAHNRLFIGCRGSAPVLLVMNSLNGTVVATLTLGRGNDAVIYDPARAQIFTANGVDGNIVIYDQTDADHYKLDQAITTRPGARTLARDSAGDRLFTVTAEGAVDPSKGVNTGPSPFYPNHAFDNTFIVLTYQK